MKKNIVLIGFMATGKSTIGKVISKSLHMEFIDTDTFIENKTDLKVSDIFKKYGESFFRKRETEVIKSISERENLVISTGGGIILKAENIRYLSKKGMLFLLDGTVNTIIRNIKMSSFKRPLLAEGDIHQRVTEILEKRRNLYRQYADYVIEIDNKKPDEIANNIVEIYKNNYLV